MSKKPDAKPMYPLKHEFVASLDRYLHQSRMLADAVRMALELPGVIRNENLRKALQERLAEFEQASGD
jgi:hypothetical protein